MGVEAVSHRYSCEVAKHIELAKKFLAKGRGLIDRDPVQASEKLYKAAEEIVKALAIALELPEASIASESGRWRTTLLDNAVRGIAKKLGIEDFRRWWASAYYLYVEGFHEARLSSEAVKEWYGDVEAMVNLAEKVLRSLLINKV